MDEALVVVCEGIREGSSSYLARVETLFFYTKALIDSTSGGWYKL
jgi:hypothetical protein